VDGTNRDETPGRGSTAAAGRPARPPGLPRAVIFSAIGVRRCLVICSVVTEDAQSRMRGYGPFHEGAEPTAQITTESSPAAPTSAPPMSPGPISAQPSSSGAPYPVDSTGLPVSGAPYPVDSTGLPVSGAPYPLDSTGLPVSATPYDFTAAAPTQSRPDWSPAPTSGGAPDFTYTGRRIEPSPPPDRNRLIIGLVAGLVAGLLLFGTAGYFVGNNSAHPKTATPTPTPTPTSSLGVFEQNQVAQNQAHFTSSALTPLAQGWLPYLSTCARSGEAGGPKPNPGEKTRVRCTLSGMSVVFVEYASLADRDKARVKTLGQNVDARALTPGVGAATQRPAPSARTTGNYVEYAYKLTEGRAVRTVAGIWWDDAQTPVAAYLLAYWTEGVGESWDPMRDLWSRYA
jgi:hypothetical protein